MRILKIFSMSAVLFLFGTQALAFIPGVNSQRDNGCELAQGKGGGKGMSGTRGRSSEMQWKGTRDESRRAREEIRTQEQQEWKQMREEEGEGWQEQMQGSQQEMRQERELLRKEWQGEKDDELKGDKGKPQEDTEGDTDESGDTEKDQPEEDVENPEGEEETETQEEDK